MALKTAWRIMAVDDDRDILELIRLSLEPKYEVLTFNEPLMALQAVTPVEPDLLILDIMMPKLTGYQFLERMKNSARHAALPVLFLSAKDANRDVKYGYKLGVSVYLTKPFQPDRLLRNIDSLFQRTPPPKTAKRHLQAELEERFKAGTRLGRDFSSSAPKAADGASPDAEGEEEKTGPAWMD